MAKYKKKLHLIAAFALAVLGMTLALPRTIQAQQDDPTSSGQTPGATKPAGKTTVLAVPSDQDQDTTPPATGQIQELGRGGWLGPTTSPLRWGSLYIDTLEFDQGYDNFDGPPSANPGLVHTSLFQTGVVYDLQLARSRFALQWRPEVGSINGHFANNLNNENASLTYATMLTPRLSASFQDQVTYGAVRNVFFDSYLYAAQAAGNTSVQNNFLDGSGTRISNNAGLTLDYGLSPRTDIAFTPGFNYNEQFGGPTFLVGSKEFIGTVHITYKLSPRKSIGALYTGNVVKFDNVAGYIVYNNVGGTFTDELSRTWLFSSTFGVSRATLVGNSVYWSFYGNANLNKKFRTSTVALAYSRGLNLEQYNTQYFTDRVDLTDSIQLSRKIHATIGGGYQRAGGTPTIWGKYGTSQIGYSFIPSLALLATYTYISQVGNNMQIYTETRNTAYLTLRWQPPRIR